MYSEKWESPTLWNFKAKKEPNQAWRPSCCCCSVAKSCPTLFSPMDCSTQSSLSFTISWRLLKSMSIDSVMPSNHLIFCCPLLLLPSRGPYLWSVFQQIVTLYYEFQPVTLKKDPSPPPLPRPSSVIINILTVFVPHQRRTLLKIPIQFLQVLAFEAGCLKSLNVLQQGLHIQRTVDAE